MRGSSAFLVVAFLGISFFGLASASSAPEAPANMARHWVMHEGRNIEVYGYLNAKGQVVWNPGVAENARPRERRTKPVDGPNGRMPSAEIKTEPPTAAPPPANPDWRTNGVNRPAHPAPVERYTAHSADAKKFIAQSLEAPAGKLHVTIVGNADERARVANDIKTDPAFEGIRDDLWVQDYDPKDWPVNPELGFVHGKPAIIVQAAKGPNDPKGGRVIYRTMDYSIGAKGLAEAIRKAEPPGPPRPVPDRPDLPRCRRPRDCRHPTEERQVVP
jgi:hypothetical protein